MSSSSELDRIVKDVTACFRTFGGGRTDGAEYNPLVAIMKDHDPVFAAGVDVRKVVEFVATALRKKHGSHIRRSP